MRTKTPTGVNLGNVALHTGTGSKRRRCKGLEPSRRLSETTGPRSPSAFRVVVRATEVRKRGAWCKSAAAFITHGAPGQAPLPQRTGAAAHFPAVQASSVQRPAFEALALRTHVTACSGVVITPVTAASAARTRAAVRSPTSAARTEPRQSCGARRRMRRRQRPHGGRHGRRRGRGRWCGVPAGAGRSDHRAADAVPAEGSVTPTIDE